MTREKEGGRGENKGEKRSKARKKRVSSQLGSSKAT